MVHWDILYVSKIKLIQEDGGFEEGGIRDGGKIVDGEIEEGGCEETFFLFKPNLKNM